MLAALVLLLGMGVSGADADAAVRGVLNLAWVFVLCCVVEGEVVVQVMLVIYTHRNWNR